MFQTKVVEQIKTHILCTITFFDNFTVYEKMWENTVERGRSHDNIIWRMRIECWVTKARIRTYARIIEYVFFFSTGTMVTRTLLSLTLYVYVLSCFLKQYGTRT